MKRKNILLDLCYGEGDAAAIYLALHTANVSLMGITTVFGKTDVDLVHNQICSLLAQLDQPFVALSMGNSQPLRKERQNRLLKQGGVSAKNPTAGKIDPLPAWDFIASVIPKPCDRVSIVTTGPLTNIAKFLLKYSDIAYRIEQIVLVGGSVSATDETPYAETNIFLDPDAANIVLQSKIPLVFCTADVTSQGYITCEEARQLTSKYPQIAPVLAGEWTAQRPSPEQNTPLDIQSLKGAVAMAYVIDPTLVQTVPANVSIELKSSTRLGQTKLDFANSCCGYRAKVAICANREHILQLFYRCSGRT